MPTSKTPSHRTRKPRLKFGVFVRPSIHNTQILLGSLFIYVAVYWRDLIGGSFPGSPSLALLLIGTIVLLLTHGLKFSNFEMFFSLAISTFALANSAMAQSSSISNYLIAPVIALVISKSARPTFKTFMIFHAIISILIQAYEHLNGAYVFAIVEDGMILDSELFSGNADIMRAKGLFQGPLSAVAFYILISLIHPNVRTITIGMAGAVLAYGRLGIVITFLIFSARVLTKSDSINRILLILFSTLFLIIVPEFISLPSFFASAFDISSANNAARIYFWITNLSHYSNYPLLNLAFGELGYANRVIGSTENDFIRALMDTGIMGLSIYLLALISAFRKAIHLGYEKAFHIFVVIIAMFAFPLIQSLNATILFWIYIWGFFHGHEDSK